MFIFVFVFFCSSVFANNLGPSPVDPDYEKLIYGIYDKHHSQPTSSDEWSQTIYQKNIKTYSVKKGENLWDVSRSLFGKPDYWSKLWAVNPDLQNPHSIPAGHSLNLLDTPQYRSQSNQAPVNRPQVRTAEQESTQVSPVSAEDNTQPPVQENLVSRVTKNEQYVMNESSLRPPASDCVDNLGKIIQHTGMTRAYDQEFKCQAFKRKVIARRVLDKSKIDKFENSDRASFLSKRKATAIKKQPPIPKSLPYISLIKNRKEFIFKEDAPLEAEKRNIITNYQIDESDIDIVGRVSEIIGGIPVTSGEVIVKLDVPAQVGDSFSIIRPIQPIQSQVILPFILEGGIGEEVVMQARVAITGAISRKRGMYFAEITSMYNPINTRSHIIREDVSTFELGGRFRKGTTRSQIVATASGQSGSMLMIHSFVYLNKGSEDGISLGDVFDIQSNRRLHGRNIKQSLGEVLVVHITPSYSTAFVKNLRNLAYVGDYATSFESLDLYNQDEEDVVETKSSEFIEDEEEDVIGENEFTEEEDLIEMKDDEEEVIEPPTNNSEDEEFADIEEDDDEKLMNLSKAESAESFKGMADEYDDEEQEWLAE